MTRTTAVLARVHCLYSLSLFFFLEAKQRGVEGAARVNRARVAGRMVLINFRSVISLYNSAHRRFPRLKRAFPRHDERDSIRDVPNDGIPCTGRALNGVPTLSEKATRCG